MLEKSYLCGIGGDGAGIKTSELYVVICLKSLTFVVSITTVIIDKALFVSCDLLEKSYLCGINNNISVDIIDYLEVVICLKSLTFVVSITTQRVVQFSIYQL